MEPNPTTEETISHHDIRIAVNRDKIDDIEQRLDAMDLQIASLEEAAYNPQHKQALYQYAGWAMIGLVQQRWNSPADTADLAVEMAKALLARLEEETQPEGQAND